MLCRQKHINWPPGHILIAVFVMPQYTSHLWEILLHLTQSEASSASKWHHNIQFTLPYQSGWEQSTLTSQCLVHHLHVDPLLHAQSIFPNWQTRSPALTMQEQYEPKNRTPFVDPDKTYNAVQKVKAHLLAIHCCRPWLQKNEEAYQ